MRRSVDGTARPRVVLGASVVWLLVLLAACGDGTDPPPPSPAPAAELRLTIDLERPPAGAPDGGMVAGHRGGGLHADVEGAELAFHGRVKPDDAGVEVTGAATRVGRLRGGAFVVRVAGLMRGETRLVVSASPPRGAARLRESVTVTRRPSGVGAAREPQGVEPDRGPPGAAEASGGRVDIDIRDFAFTPRSVALKRGQMVVWRNRDGAQHTVVAGRSGTALGSGRLAPGDRYDYTALDAGVVGYACRIHGWMRGVLRVADG